jgi:type IV pilus assembly protein PilQ
VFVAMATSPPASATPKNEVRAVSFDEDGGMTRVHVRGATTPTFTVYKLERPSRVVIDLPQARLAEAMRGHESSAVLTPNTWAVSTIAAQQLDDGAVRVIVTLARPGRYDVKTDGNAVVIMVMPRDPAPKHATPADLARMQAENEQAKQHARASEQARVAAERSSEAASMTAKQSRAEADAAKAEAERLRKLAAEQAAKAEAAQRTVEAAKKQLAANATSTADLQRAQQLAQRAQDEAARAKAEAAKATSDAEGAKHSAQRAQVEAERMKLAAEQARRDAVAEAASAKADATKAREEMARTQADATKAREEMARTKADAAKAREEIARTQAEATKARDEMARTQVEAQRAREEAARKQLEATKAREEVARSQAEAQRVKEEIARKQLEAMKAREEMARTKAEAEKVRAEIAAKQVEATKAREATLRMQQDAERAKADLARAQAEAQAAVAKSRAEADQAKRDASVAISAAQREVAVAKTDAAKARSEAETAKAQAAADKKQAELDKQNAEFARADAEKMLKDAKGQLATLEHKTLAAQQLDDKARATFAAAQAREEAARETVARAVKERAEAEAMAKRAQQARDKAAATDRTKLAAEATAAEERLATARQAAAEADVRRLSAQQAATRAMMDLEQTKTALASVEQQRVSAVTAATDAARKRSEAEAAASDAARRRREAEVAAIEAAKKRKEAEAGASEAAKRKSQAEIDRAAAEAQRVAAQQATRDARAAAEAAEKQRKIAETSAQQAIAAKRDAEASIAALTAKRQAAEKAADELAARAKAEARAQAQVAAAQARKANEEDMAAAKREVARLADERKRAEADLAERRKAVAQQQAESARLATTAAQAKDAADREETRRTQLAEQRAQEEQELARIKAQKVQAQIAQAQARTPAPVPPVDAAPAPKPASTPAKQAHVNSITFNGNADSGVVELAMAGEANVQLGEISASHVELIIDNANLAPKLERTLDVSKFGSPVKKVSSFRDRRTPNRVRLIAELSSSAIPTVVRDATTVRWRFAANDVAQTKPARAQQMPTPVVGGFGAASTPVAQQSVTQVPPARGRRIYHGATVEFDFKDAPIHDLLRIIADTGGVNIVVPDTIDAKVTVRLKRVPWDQALEVILASHGLWYRREGNLYRIAPRKELDAEDEAEAARRAAAANAEMPRPEVVRLNYASADELKPKLEGMLSPKGKIEVDGRTNALIISDIAANRGEIARLALELDTQTPQITIEARIVEARSTFVRQFGIQWGGRALMGAAGGNATGLIFPSSVGIRGGNDDNQTRTGGISALPSDFAINLPAATGTGEGGAIGLSLGSVGGNFNINLRLSALEDTGSVRIISAPKITVLNNKSALIRQGVSIPISVVSAAGTQTQFVQADLKLEVTPYVSQRDCAIAMNLDVTKNEPDFVNVGARGDPTILRKEARTTMLVADGETSVLGGIYTRNTGLAWKKVPFFADIPVIGWFFKNRRENDDRTEILVFITPKITNKANLRCAQ